LDFQVILGDENGSQDHSKGSTSSAPVGSIPTTLPLATVGTGNFDNFLRRRLEAFEFQESDLLPTPITQQEIQPTRSKPNTGRERPFNNNDNDNNDNDNDNDNGNDNDNNDNEQNGYTTTKQQFATKNHPTKANSDGESFELQAAAQQLKDRKAQMISRQNNSDVNNSFDGYAVKVVRDDIHNERKKRVATADMASEAKLLSALSHRNIISIRGIMGYIEHPGNYGIIMDKLRSTLQDQIHEWARVTSEDKVPRAAPGKHPVLEHIPQWMLVRQHEKDKQRKLFRQTEFFVERMEAVSDVSQAMKYLHEKRIIFRDLKPENVGLTKDNYVLFDFGLSRELTESDRVVGGNDAKCEDQYHATGLTGSRLFMAPEVATNKPYGFSADVYSFAILFWEVVSLTQVFPTMTMNKHYKLVIVKGKRPPSLEDILPSELNEMLEASWDKVPSNRPTFESICEILTHELEKHDNNNNNNNNNNTSASSFLPFLNKNNASASSFLHFLSHSHQATEPQP
jgi:serine/threonine protein kinase